MTNQEQRKAAFVQLGQVLKALGKNQIWPGFSIGLDESEYQSLVELAENIHYQNPWFTPENVRRAFSSWGHNLSDENLSRWLEPYALPEPSNSKKVGIVMAGNIPMVGFHDLLSVLISGHTAMVKLSSSDNRLIPSIVDVLGNFAPELKERVLFVDQLKDFDAVIATGSNNSARYFQQYFSKVPNIIRGNRNSVAIVDDTSTDEDLQRLGDDIFAYFGLGCRNVTHLWLPEQFDIDRFFKAIFPFHDIVNHHKYANNYDYYKALYMMNSEQLLDNGFLILRPNEALYSALGTLHFQRYNREETVKTFLQSEQNNIQCVIGNDRWGETVSPGESQQPALWDYADRVDTLEFLRKL